MITDYFYHSDRLEGEIFTDKFMCHMYDKLVLKLICFGPQGFKLNDPSQGQRTLPEKKVVNVFLELDVKELMI